MKSNQRTILSALIPIVTLFLGFSSMTAQTTGTDSEREPAISRIISAMLEAEHYHPLMVDRDLAEKAFGLYLERLDPSKQFLLESDVKELTAQSDKMIDAFRNGDYSLLNRASEIFEQRVAQMKELYPQLLDKPFDFSKDEYLITNPDSIQYATSTGELRERWRKALKYQTLLRYLNMVDDEDEDADEFHDDIEEKSREAVVKSTTRWFERLNGINRENHLSRYVNALVNVFDPHTEYYPPLEKENFDISITGQLEGIGAQLREEDGYIKVVDIVPGSASWKGKELEVEDLIMKVAQEDAEPVDVVGASIDDAVKLIRGAKGTKVTLTVKKPDGRIKPITITRDVVVLEETYAKGAIIENENQGRRYGYIDLPKFYTDFNRTGSPRAGDDMRRILTEFKKQGVEGVVLDLRNNGGGSLQEAVDIAGLFIKSGPVVQVQDRNGNRQVLSDQNDDIVWDGELVVMINSFSASASEILSGMLQDYERAVIVGAPSTFGKGTVQRFYDLDDRLSRAYRSLAPLGSIKITTQQFYRVNGASTQFDGVVPDVILPDVFSYRAIGEKSLDYPLPGDTIQAARYLRWLNRDIPSAKLSASSSERVSGSRMFGLIEEQAERMRDEQYRSTRSLNWREALAEQKRLQSEADELDKAEPDLSYLQIEPLKQDIDDEVRAEMIKTFIENIGKDVYVDEAISILNDMRSLSLEYGWSFHDEDSKGSE